MASSRKVTPEILRKHIGGDADVPGTMRVAWERLSAFRDDVIRLFRGLDVVTISGTIAVSSINLGASLRIAVDHTSSASFRLAEYPRFTLVDGIDVTVLAIGSISDVDYPTNGVKFIIKIDNLTKDDGGGGTSSGTFDLPWTRAGLL